ncbi:MAG: Na+/H+ antiporter NhaA [bacterium]|nr:Na+/H+ antiporter NhaA [Candidatus Kapabacteria bacterium]
MATRRLSRFMRTASAGSIVLIASTVVALVWANSIWSSSYHSLWEAHIAIGSGDFAIDHTLREWVTDALMAVFFFWVGLTLKREMRIGELSSIRKAALPIAAALGGMIVPALIYLALNAGTETARGWGVPIATDIAFALAILALLRSRAPIALTAFLSALAIADDLGAIAVIALIYNSNLSLLYLSLAAIPIALLAIANRSGVRSNAVYLIVGFFVWLFVLKSGVHATIAGVAVAMIIPVGDNARRLEHWLEPWVAFAIMPIFALANAGVAIDGDFASAFTMPVTLGVVLGLFIGKQIGIAAFAWLAVRFGVGELPSGATWRHIYGVALLGGIGFTMSIFIAGLAFVDVRALNNAKIGILIGSLVSAVAGWIVLRVTPPTARNPDPVQPAS